MDTTLAQTCDLLLLDRETYLHLWEVTHTHPMAFHTTDEGWFRFQLDLVLDSLPDWVATEPALTRLGFSSRGVLKLAPWIERYNSHFSLSSLIHTWVDLALEVRPHLTTTTVTSQGSLADFSVHPVPPCSGFPQNLIDSLRSGARPNSWYFHGTTLKAAEAIIQEGFGGFNGFRTDCDFGSGYYLAQNPREAWNYAGRFQGIQEAPQLAMLGTASSPLPGKTHRPVPPCALSISPMLGTNGR